MFQSSFDCAHKSSSIVSHRTACPCHISRSASRFPVKTRIACNFISMFILTVSCISCNLHRHMVRAHGAGHSQVGRRKHGGARRDGREERGCRILGGIDDAAPAASPDHQYAPHPPPKSSIYTISIVSSRGLSPYSHVCFGFGCELDSLHWYQQSWSPRSSLFVTRPPGPSPAVLFPPSASMPALQTY